MDNCITKEDCKACRELYDQYNREQNRRIDTLEETVKKIQEIAIAVEKMAMSIDQMTKELVKQGERLDRIESEPATKWKNAVWLLTAGLIGAVLSFMLGRLGL